MIRFPQDAKAIIDVTKPPYNADSSGKTDCTKALCQAIDFITGEYLERFQETVQKLAQMPGPDAKMGFEIRRENNRDIVIWPEELPPAHILYFPKGTYLVSDTITYSQRYYRNIFGNRPYLEMNGRLRFCGESRDDVIIKLQDHCKGFEYGNDRPVVSFMRGEASNVAMTNMFENITIDIGVGNPGATGLVFFANNTGAIRNICIRSSDEKGAGCCGLEIMHDKQSALYAKNIQVEGFDYGIRVTPQTLCAYFEHICLVHQNRIGFFVGNTVISIRDLYSNNQVPALRMQGFTGHTVLVDAVLEGGHPDDFAIRHEFGFCFLRNIKTSGYQSAMTAYRDCPHGKEIKECSFNGVYTGLDQKSSCSLNLPVEETPEIPWDDPETWADVMQFGALGDGKTDDTSAIQAALDSGASTVYFQPGRYLIGASLHVPAKVNRINFMYADLACTQGLRESEQSGTFAVREESDTPLVVEDLFAFEQYYGKMVFLKHECRRTVILSDVHIQTGAMYRNTVSGGKVFIENCACTIGGKPATGKSGRQAELEKEYCYNRSTPCFSFTGQQVWARQINPERCLHEVVNDGSTLWVLGFKTEEEGTGFETRNGGKTEVLGGIFCLCYVPGHPAILNDNSDVSVIASGLGFSDSQYFPVAVREIRGTESQELIHTQFPPRFLFNYSIPLYVGKLSDK